MNSGKFIVLEGIDGSGKSTIANTIVNDLHNQGIDVLHVRIPDIHGIGGDIRTLMLEKAGNCSKEVQAMLFGASLLSTVESTIIPALMQGRTVICERYTMSTRVYQGSGGICGDIVNYIESIIKPDLTILLDIDEDTYINRLMNRPYIDSIETFKVCTIKHRRQSYLKEIAKQKHSTVIDSTMNMESVITACKQTISKTIKFDIE